MNDLHPTAKKIYHYICHYKEMNGGDSPTQRQMAQHAGLADHRIVRTHLEALEAEGLIERQENRHRHILVKGAVWYPPTKAPIVAMLAKAGEGTG